MKVINVYTVIITLILIITLGTSTVLYFTEGKKNKTIDTPIVEIINIDNCQYITVRPKEKISSITTINIIHKENCNNEIHN